jgi:hypothetical protein
MSLGWTSTHRSPCHGMQCIFTLSWPLTLWIGQNWPNLQLLTILHMWKFFKWDVKHTFKFLNYHTQSSLKAHLYKSRTLMCYEYLNLVLLLFRETYGTSSLHIKMLLSTSAYGTLQKVVAVWKAFGHISTYFWICCINEWISTDGILKEIEHIWQS